VASSGHSYLSPDTAADPLYLKGAEGARSSMTVPLKFQDEVIGTLNVESPRPNGFGPDDLQFTELFSKEIATALHTLNLLRAQEDCTVSQVIEAVNKETALPLDDVLASASVLLGTVEADSETGRHLRRILDGARLVKESVSKVGRDLPAGPCGTGPLAGKRVLVVDQDEHIRRQAHLLLSRLGATVETAVTALAALAMAADTPYDAILLEVKPRDLGGYESYRRFRTARPGSVLALTMGFGYDESHVIVKARQDGLKKELVLFKPLREEQVVRAVLDRVAQPVPLASGA
jgi:CheY-like chemotaxis protein